MGIATMNPPEIAYEGVAYQLNATSNAYHMVSDAQPYLAREERVSRFPPDPMRDSFPYRTIAFLELHPELASVSPSPQLYADTSSTVREMGQTDEPKKPKKPSIRSRWQRMFGIETHRPDGVPYSQSSKKALSGEFKTGIQGRLNILDMTLICCAARDDFAPLVELMQVMSEQESEEVDLIMIFLLRHFDEKRRVGLQTDQTYRDLVFDSTRDRSPLLKTILRHLQGPEITIRINEAKGGYDGITELSRDQEVNKRLLDMYSWVASKWKVIEHSPPISIDEWQYPDTYSSEVRGAV